MPGMLLLTVPGTVIGVVALFCGEIWMGCWMVAAAD